MNKGSKIAAIAVGALLVLAGGGYGAWYAWDNGKFGDNPRAPTPQAMEKAVRFQAAYLVMATGARQPCLSLDLGSAQPEIVGIPGIGQQSVPGMHAAMPRLVEPPKDAPARHEENPAKPRVG